MADQTSGRSFTLSLLPDLYAIIKFPANFPFPAWISPTGFSSVTRTADELSVVAAVHEVPTQYPIPLKWRAMKVHGPLAFTEIGVLESLAVPLRAAKVSVFVISTYDTDYLLVTEDKAGTAVAALTAAGHHFAQG